MAATTDAPWWPGCFDADDWRKVGGRWGAMVRWSTGPAENRIGTFDRYDIRQVSNRGIRQV